MNTRENLKNDIEKFEKEVDSNQLLGPSWLAKESTYRYLEKRIFALELNDFESQEKFNSFSRYINQGRTKELMTEISNSFNNNPLDMLGVLTMGDFFIGVKEVLK